MKQFLVFFILIASTSSFALPKKFEVWFLSESQPETTWLEPSYKSTFVAQRALQCQPMGDHCFDPQVGLYKKGTEPGSYEEVSPATVEDTKKYDFMDVHAGHDRKMIDCDQAQMFDIFCGKSQKRMKEGKSKLEVWVDVSSTMKQVDFVDFDTECRRERFLRDLNATCPVNEKMKVYYFEEFRKEAGAFDRVCLSGGLNNMKRIIQDLKLSKAETVIIITDIFEADETFIDAIEATGRGTIRGLNKPLYATDLKKELKRIRKFCL